MISVIYKTFNIERREYLVIWKCVGTKFIDKFYYKYKIQLNKSHELKKK